MKKTIEFEVDAEVAASAEAVFAALGLDTESALTIFLRRTALERRFPLDMNAPAPGAPIKQSADEKIPFEDTIAVQPSTGTQPQRTNKAITQDMVEDLWERFSEFCQNGGDIRAISDDIATRTGMNPGSAFIYLVILNNLVHARHNTRNMKMRDLEFYMEKIRDDISEEAFRNALISLEQSVPYWDKPQFGSFAANVKDYIEQTRSKGE